LHPTVETLSRPIFKELKMINKMSRSWIPLPGLTTPSHEIRQLSAHLVNQGGDGFPSTLHHPDFRQKPTPFDQYAIQER
jgi:hypothetical protein